MNRILKTFLIAATAVSGAAFAQDTATQEITGNVGATISISVEQATNTISLDPNSTNPVDNAVFVSSTEAFTVTARADNATMTEYETDTSSYVTASKLAAAAEIDASTLGAFGGTDVLKLPLSTDDQVIFNGTGAVNNGQIDTQITQAVTHTEQLTNGNSYRMVVTYTAAFVQ